MNRNGSIVLIDDDIDDLLIFEEIVGEVLKENGYANNVITFNDPLKACEHLTQLEDAPFLIISDINMPKMDGIKLRRQIKKDACAAVTCSPFIFLSTAAANTLLIKEAYTFSIQGFFTKPNSFEDYKCLLEKVLTYWKDCNLPPQAWNVIDGVA